MNLVKQDRELLRRRIRTLFSAERRDMCWEVGYFRTPMFVKEPGELPINPFLLVCIDTASRTVMGDLLSREAPSVQDFLFLLVSSMEAPCVKELSSVLPRCVRLDNAAAMTLLGRELGRLGTEFELVEQLPFLREFAEISEREFFSRQPGYAGGRN